MADNEWPQSVLFTGDGIHAQFATADDLNRWQAEERKAWTGIIGNASGNHWANAMVQNVNLLNALVSDRSPSTLQHIANEYHPSNGTLARYVGRIQNPQVKWATYAELTQPGATGAQQGGDFVQARSLATLYQAIGRNLVAIEQAGDIAQSIQVAVDDVNRLRQSDQGLIDRFNGLMTQCETDWKNKIEGFETRAALKAPRTYWNARSERHGNLAGKDKREWSAVVWLLVGLILLVAGLDLYFPTPTGSVAAITVTIQRLIIFGTLLAVAVWWLRQKLRDVRMHEHFAEDAAERATMIETYAAMRGEGLPDKDLGVIVAALYRPAAGNLSDDGGPVLPTEALIRAVADVASKT